MSFIDTGMLLRPNVRAFAPTQLNPLAWYDVHLATAGQTVTDQMGGTAATLGSTAGADANDPIWLTWAGTDYLWLPGVASNSPRLPDVAAMHITGDIDVRFDGALADWTPASPQVALVTKWAGGTQRCFSFHVNDATGKPEFWWTPDGTNASKKTATSTVAPTIADGVRLQTRVTLDVDNGAAGYDVKFYTRDPALSLTLSDNSSWTQLGTTVTGAGVTSIFAGTDRVVLGAIDAAAWEREMSIYHATVHTGIAGTTVVDFDPAQFARGSSTSYTDTVGTNGGVWAINRSTAGRKAALVKGRGLLLLGTDDLWTASSASIPSFGTATPGTVTVIGRAWGTPLTNGRWIDTRGSATETVAGVGIRQNGTAASLVGTIGDGTSSATTAAVTYTAGRIVVASLVVDTTTIKLRVNGTESATVARPAGSATGGVGIVGAATTAAASVFEGESFDVLTANRVLTSSELDKVERNYGAGT